MSSEIQLARPQVPWQIAWGNAPIEGSQVVPLIVDFTIESPANFNLQDLQMKQKLEQVQSLFIDNSLNPAALSITSRGTGQVMTVPGFWQGYLPVLCTASNPHLSFLTTGTPTVNVQLINAPMPAEMWPASNAAISGAGDIGTDASGNKPVLLANLLATLAANPARKYFEYQNQSGNLHQVVMDDGAGNNVSISLVNAAGANTPGGSYTNSFETGRVRIFGVTNDQFYLRQN